MGKRDFAGLVGALLGAVVVFMGLLVAGLRWQLTPVVDAVRRVNRSVTNPRVMRTAGTAGTQTSIIRARRAHVRAGLRNTRRHHRNSDRTVDRAAVRNPGRLAAQCIDRRVGHRGRAVASRSTSTGRAIVATVRCGGDDPRTHVANTAAVRCPPVPASREVMNLVDPAHPPSRKAPLVWAIGAAIPWLLLVVAQVVWFVLDARLGWLHALAAAVTVLGGDGVRRRGAAVALSRAPLGHRRQGRLHPIGLAGAGAPDRADLAGADRRHRAGARWTGCSGWRTSR